MKIKLMKIWESLFPKRITPDNITSLESNEIFVFGSNTGGFHGAGAARTALQWGAKMRVGVGLSGKTYAIPTKDVIKNGKDSFLETMPLDDIQLYVNKFIEFAKSHPNMKFLVTKIGCGLANYNENDIAPLFKNTVNIRNIYLPQEFWDILG